MSDRAENLEGIEERLKNDILQESQKFVVLRFMKSLLKHHNSAGMGA